MYYTYLLDIGSNKFYIGYTSDLKRRVGEHTKSRQQAKLVYYEAYLSEETARARELLLKQYGGSWRMLRKRLNIK